MRVRKADVQQFFDRASEYWDERITHDDVKIAQVLDSISFQSKRKILDVGTGTGIMVDKILPRLPEKGSIFGVDISPQMIARARGKIQDPRVHFKVGDIEDMLCVDQDLKDSVLIKDLDLVLCYSVFPHFEKKKLVLSGFHDVLEKGGELLIFHTKSREAINEMHGQLGYPVSDHKLPPIEDLIDWCQQKGFQVSRAESTDAHYLLLAVKP